jgi:uncharacterized protein YegL
MNNGGLMSKTPANKIYPYLEGSLRQLIDKKKQLEKQKETTLNKMFNLLKQKVIQPNDLSISTVELLKAYAEDAED